MTNDAATALIVDVAKGFISLVRDLDPSWRRAWFRFQADVGVAEAKGSYANDTEVNLVDAVVNKAFFHTATRQGRDLMAALGHDRGVFLLSADSDFNYKIDFEYESMTRWRISKLGGGTGVPEGLA